MTGNEMTDQTLLIDREGPAAVLTINRPERHNALTLAMFQRIPSLIARAGELSGVRALVLRGAGGKSFSAGADIGEFEAVRMAPDQAAAYDEAVLAAEEAIASFPSPTIAAIDGYCYGGGCALALACDIRFASPSARFAITPAKLGLVYPLRSTKRLVDLVGPARAKIILMTAGDLDAEAALRYRLADEIVPDMNEALSEFTALLATRSAVTQRAVKQVIGRIIDGVTRDDPAHAALAAGALASPDYAEGVRAFLERRPPVFG